VIFDYALLALLIVIVGAAINKRLGVIINMLIMGAAFVWFYTMPNMFRPIQTNVIFGYEIVFRTDALARLFGMLISGFGFISASLFFSYVRKGRNIKYMNVLLFFKFAAMILLILSYDFLSFFFSWELITIITFLVMSVGEWNNKDALKASYKYLIMSAIASFFMMAAMFIILKLFGTLKFEDISFMMSRLSNGQIVGLTLLVLVPFLTKAGVLPLHTWVADAYANSITPYTSYLTSVSSRIGTYGIILWFFSIIGHTYFTKLKIGGMSFPYLFAWLAALTMVIPTFIALLQNSGKKLLTWHGIGQGGYMLVGLGAGGALGFTGSMFHVVNYAVYIALLFVSIGAVIYRTGTDDLNELGGLIKRMPLAFLGTLIGIIGLAGIPPLNGFVSKWFIYKGLIGTRHVFLADMAFIGTLGTILSVYKYIHNVFLGQLPERYKNLQGTPKSFRAPIWILSALCVLFGVYPGIVTQLIAAVQQNFGMIQSPVTVHGIAAAAGHLNMLVVSLTFSGTLVLAGIIFFLGGRRKYVDQYDNYAGGEKVTPETLYHYSAEFYAPLYRIIKPVLRYSVDSFYMWTANLVQRLSNFVYEYFNYNFSRAFYFIIIFSALIFVYRFKGMLW